MREDVSVPRCDYHVGMFSIEDYPTASDEFAIYFEGETACLHEAGHSVVGRFLGLGCVSVSVIYDCVQREGGAGLGVGIGGMALYAKAPGRRDSSSLSRKDKERAVRAGMRQAVAACAGPAAEYRYRTEQGLPLRLLLSAQGDHDAVDKIGRHLEANSFVDCHDFRDAAWRRAQELVERDDIWDAITELGARLYELVEWDGSEGRHTFTMPGHVARSIMRQVGKVRHG